jgi:hypothetical protein
VTEEGRLWRLGPKNGSRSGGKNYENVLNAATLKEWVANTAEGELPAIILNSTIVEKGQRLASGSPSCREHIEATLAAPCG